jgi:hypothetical protein
MASVRITGIQAIQKALKELEPKLAKKVIRKASRDAIKIPYAKAKAEWPVESGASKKSIRVRTSKGPRSAQKNAISIALIVGQAGRPGDKEKGINRPWWPFLIERGFHVGGKRVRSGGKTTGYEPTKSGGAIKKIEGKFIMRRALKSTEGEVKEFMEIRILSGLEQLANRGSA